MKSACQVLTAANQNAVTQGDLRCQWKPGEQPLHRQRSLENDAVQVSDEPAVRIETAIADRKSEQLRQQVAEAMTVVAVERFGTAEGKNRDAVGRDGLDMLEECRGNLLAQVPLQGNPAVGEECRVIDAHQ